MARSIFTRVEAWATESLPTNFWRVAGETLPDSRISAICALELRAGGYSDLGQVNRDAPLRF